MIKFNNINVKILLIFFYLFIYGCGYPDINDVPYEIELEITHEDRVNINKLKKEVNE